MDIRFNVKGEKRKELVSIISGITGETAVYTRVPKCSYVIGSLEVDREGTLLCGENADIRVIRQILETAGAAGIGPARDTVLPGTETEEEAGGAAAESDHAEESSAPVEAAAAPAEAADSAPEAAQSADSWAGGLTVTLPMDAADVAKLAKILEAKGALIRKALGIDDLPVEAGEEAVSFPWFSETLDADEAKAYTDLIAALCRMSREQKRVTATEHAVENEKYAFRCFLLRLGFIGAEYKTDRKILLRNLSGSAAFKRGARISAPGTAVPTQQGTGSTPAASAEIDEAGRVLPDGKEAADAVPA